MGTKFHAIVHRHPRRDTLRWPSRVWLYPMEWLIGYGHKPGRAIWAALFVISIGFLVFWRAYKAERIVATEDWAHKNDPNLVEKPPDQLVFNYPRFSALVYSIDVFIPLVNLRQAGHWIPRSGTWPMIWMRVQTSAGWIVMTLLAAGLTGLVGG